MRIVKSLLTPLANNSGSTYVEMAFALPVLFFLLFAIFELSFVLTYDNALVSVVDYGIRAIAINGHMDAMIEDKINEQLLLKGLDASKAEVYATRSPVNYRDNVYLHIKYPYRFALLGTDKVLNYQVMLEAKSYAVCEKYTR